MIKKKSFGSYALLVATAIALILSLATTFSWFSSRFVTRDFTFTTAKMGSAVKLYEAVDFDYDGYPNLVDAVEQFVEEEQIKADDSDKMITILSINNMLPSQIYTYKINVTNNGTVKSEVLAEFSYVGSNLTILQSLAVTPILLGENNTILKGEKCYLADPKYMSYDADGNPTAFNGITFINNEAYAPFFQDYQNDYADLDFRTSVGNQKDFYFQIEMVPYDEIKAEYPNIALTESDYNNLQGYSTGNDNVNLLFLVALEAEEFQGVAPETSSQ